MNTPYNTGKVKIGLRYQAPAPVNDSDMDRVQSALTQSCPRLQRNHRADTLSSLVQATLWGASACMFIAVVRSPAIWTFFSSP